MTIRTADAAPFARRDRLCLAMVMVAAVAALLPVFAVESLPLHDYPSHLARMVVLMQAGQDATLNQFYQVQWALMPNLAMDLTVPPLARLLGSVELAGKLFVAATMLLLVTGTAFLHAAIHRRVTSWPLLAAVVLYNGILWFGFLNFLCGLALFLWAFGLFVRAQDWPSLPRIALAVAMSLVLFVAHLFGFALFLVAVAGWSFGRMWARELDFRGVVREGLLVLPAALLCGALFVLASPTSGVASETSWGDLKRPWHYIAKAESLLFMVHFNDGWTAAAAALVVSLVGLGIFAGWLRLDRRAVPVLALFGVCFACMPTMVSSSWFAYHRMPVVIAFFAIAAFDWTARAPWRPLSLIVLAFVLLRVGHVTEQWRALDRDFAPIRAAFRELPKGTRLTAAFAAPRDGTVPALLHVPSHVVVDADGFYPGVFSFPGQQPITFTPAYADLGGHTGSRSIFHTFPLNRDALGPRFDPFRPALLARFDVLLTYRDPLFGALPPGVTLLRESGPWRLYRLSH